MAERKITNLLFVYIPGEPVGKARPRVTRTGHAYTPDKTVSYENLVKMLFRQAYPDWIPTTAEVRVEIEAYYKVPKSASKKKKQLMVDGVIRPTKKPDIDNIAKIVNDALNGIAWVDDTQIVIEDIKKLYSDKPGVDIHIFTYGGGKE